MKETFNYLEKLLNKDDVIVMATSSGPDSMTLLSMVCLLKDKYNLKIICAHVNHGLRKESDIEADYLKEYCKVNNIIFEYKKLDKYKDIKFKESDGRKERYIFFDEIVNKYNAKYLFTAHHGDDLIETILMRIVRGSNVKGYIGIPQIQDNGKYKLVRPLLFETKKDIIKYADDNNIKYFIDKSNDDEKYTRNRYRKQVLPFLKNEDINVHLKFLKYSKELEECNNYINSIVNKKIKNIYNGKYINIELLSKEDEYIQKRIIEYVIEDIQKKDIFNINDSELNNIIKLINSNKNSSINLADNYIARKSYNKLYIEKNNIIDEFNIEFNDEININGYYFKRLNKCNEKSNNVIKLNSKEIKLPIIIRNRKNGDKIKIKNFNGSKKVNDIFVDNKIDIKERDRFPLFVDSDNNILWLPKLKKSVFDKENDEKYDIIIKCMEEYDEK